MISVFRHTDSSLEVRGHADSQTDQGRRVCAGVSLIAATLFIGYQGQTPVSGEFSYFPKSDRERFAAEFSFRALNILSQKCPNEISIKDLE